MMHPEDRRAINGLLTRSDYCEPLAVIADSLERYRRSNRIFLTMTVLRRFCRRSVRYRAASRPHGTGPALACRAPRGDAADGVLKGCFARWQRPCSTGV